MKGACRDDLDEHDKGAGTDHRGVEMESVDAVTS